MTGGGGGGGAGPAGERSRGLGATPSRANLKAWFREARRAPGLGTGFTSKRTRKLYSTCVDTRELVLLMPPDVPIKFAVSFGNPPIQIILIGRKAFPHSNGGLQPYHITPTYKQTNRVR